MSGSCREVYYNYGSYLRSRGNDKALCDLITAIENGLINLGPIIPGKCSSNTATTILGKVNINPCSPATQQTSGKLTVNGGWIGPTANNPDGMVSTFLSNAINFGLTTNTGANIIGPIFQNTDCSHSNYFGAGNHIFAGSNDCSTNVIIRGNLIVDGSTVEVGDFIGEALTLNTMPLFDDTTLNIFRSPLADGNIMLVFNDTSNNIQTIGWETGLVFAIDGELANSTPSPTGLRISGMTDTPGHIRSLRGITVSNPPLPGTAIDICYNRDLSGSSLALDVYGDILMNPGNNGAAGNIDLSGGNISFYENNVLTSAIYSNGDASFNGTISLTTNPLLKKGPIYDNRMLQLYGQSTVLLDISTSVFDISNPLPANTTTDISFIVPPKYSDFNPPSLTNSIFTENYIDFSNNQLAVHDMMFEVYITVKCHFTSTTDYLTFRFIDIDNPSNVIDIDTRTSVKNMDTTLSFGPEMFIFELGNPNCDIDYSTKIWKLSVTQSGSGGYFTNNGRFVLKMKGFM